MNVRSLRFRLALWYFCSVTAIFVLAATGYWFAIRSGLNTARDEGLRVCGDPGTEPDWQVSWMIEFHSLS